MHLLGKRPHARGSMRLHREMAQLVASTARLGAGPGAAPDKLRGRCCGMRVRVSETTYLARRSTARAGTVEYPRACTIPVATAARRAHIDSRGQPVPVAQLRGPQAAFDFVRLCRITRCTTVMFAGAALDAMCGLAPNERALWIAARPHCRTAPPESHPFTQRSTLRSCSGLHVQVGFRASENNMTRRALECDDAGCRSIRTGMWSVGAGPQGAPGRLWPSKSLGHGPNALQTVRPESFNGPRLQNAGRGPSDGLNPCLSSRSGR